jgi:hypothetical protein
MIGYNNLMEDSDRKLQWIAIISLIIAVIVLWVKLDSIDKKISNTSHSNNTSVLEDRVHELQKNIKELEHSKVDGSDLSDRIRDEIDDQSE